MDEMAQKKDPLQEAIDDLIEHIHDAFKMLFQSDSIIDPINKLLERWFGFTNKLIDNPEYLSHLQVTYWQDYLLLCKELQIKLADAVKLPENLSPYHKRKKEILYGFIEKFHFLITQHLFLVIKRLFSDGETIKVEFYQRHVTQAFSLIDFIKTYPDIFVVKQKEVQ